MGKIRVLGAICVFLASGAFVWKPNRDSALGYRLYSLGSALQVYVGGMS